MLRKVLWADLYKKKAITIILMLFVFLSAFLISISTNMLITLTQALNNFFSKAQTPHYVQMTEGPVNNEAIMQWATKNKYVKQTQVVEMLLVDGANIYLGPENNSEENSVMSFDLTTQNEAFDFLLNLKGQKVSPKPSEIAVPIYFMQQNHLKIGDKVSIIDKNYRQTFTIVDFIRDSQMNPSIVHSKRLIVHPADFSRLKEHASSRTYLVEFQLNKLTDLKPFINDYQASDIPKNGPELDYHLYKILNSVTDGIVIGITILVSVLLTFVAILCLRLILLTTMEEDYRQIGIMKALGISQNMIKKLYLAKYFIIAGLACALGYLTSLALKKLFITHILLYLGMGESTVEQYAFPILAVGLVLAIILLSCQLILRKFHTITAIDALRSAIMGKSKVNINRLPLKKGVPINLNIFIGLKDVVQNRNMFALLFLVFLICSFMVILPINFYNTLRSPSFITYMGIGQSQLRIDIQHAQRSKDMFEKILTHLHRDQDIKHYAPMTTSRFKILQPDGKLENITIELGNAAMFPIKYLQGHTPIDTHDIALSYLNSKQLNKKVGDALHLWLDNHPFPMIVSGIYQDITNGGKTAKALLSHSPDTPMWYVINIDFQPHVDVSAKKRDYTKLFSPVRVTYIEEYVNQTLGDLIKQVKYIAILLIFVTMAIAILISSLFLKLLATKQHAQIAIMKALGFSLWDIRIQYLTKSLLVLNLGILFGTILCNTVGQSLVSYVWSFMGAAEIKFIIYPAQVFIICPLLLMAVVSVTTMVSIALIKKITIIEMVVE